MKNKNQPKPLAAQNPTSSFPAGPVSRPPAAAPPPAASAARATSRWLSVFLAAVVGAALGAMLMSARNAGNLRKLAEELRAEWLQSAERRAERAYAAKDAAAAGALLDLVDALEAQLQRSPASATATRQKLLIAHGRLALLYREAGRPQDFQRHLAAALALAPWAHAAITDEKSLLAFVSQQTATQGSGSGGGSSIDGGMTGGAGPGFAGAPSSTQSATLPDAQPPGKGNVMFNDAGARADVPKADVFDFGSGDFSWVGFFKSITLPYDHHVLIASHPDQPKFYLDFSDEDVRIVVDGQNPLVLPHRSNAFDGNWHSILVKRQGGTVHAYFDGRHIGSGRRDGSSGINHGWTFGHLNQDNDAQTLIGSIRDLSFWNRALSDAEIVELAKGKPLRGNEPGLVALWRLDEGEGNSFLDTVGARHGTLNGNFSWDRDANRETKMARELAERNRPFEQTYSAWRTKIESLRGEPIISFTELPEYRAFVALGRPALDGIQRKLAEGKGLDFLLAEAAIEIAGWRKDEFPGGDLVERGRRVLERLRKFPKSQRQ
jgi:hypothetical protein